MTRKGSSVKIFELHLKPQHFENSETVGRTKIASFSFKNMPGSLVIFCLKLSGG